MMIFLPEIIREIALKAHPQTAQILKRLNSICLTVISLLYRFVLHQDSWLSKHQSEQILVFGAAGI